MDFSKLKYNPVGIPNGKRFWEVCPELFKRRDAFRLVPEGVEKFSLIDLDKLIRFVVLFCDPLSPFAQEKDFEHRARQAREALGFTEKERFWMEVTESTDFFNEILFEYFKMQNNHLYETWFSLKMGLHQTNKRLRGDTMKDSDRRHLMAAIKDFAFEVKELEHQLFPDEYTAQIIAEKSARDSLTGYAEKYAQELIL